MWNLKNHTNDCVCKTETDSQKNKLMVTNRESGGQWINEEIGINTYTLQYTK